MIKLQIVGNLGKDCIVNHVNGKTVINFSVAHNEKFKDGKGDLQERTIWVECAYWTERTAVADYLKKGTQVYAEGTPEADAYTNKEGKAASTLRMRVRDVQLLGSASDENRTNGSYGNEAARTATSQPSTEAMPKEPSMVTESSQDDLPF